MLSNAEFRKSRRPAAIGVCALLLASRAFAAELVVDVRGAGGTPLAEAVVFAEPLNGEVPKPTEPMNATVDQVHKAFVPRVSVIRAGTTMHFPNSDNIRHSIYSFSPAKTFTIKLYSGKEAPPVVFDKTGLVILGCNIHDVMAAWIVVVDTPWFSKSDASGTATLKDLPPGDYKVSIWYPAPTFAPLVKQIHLGDGAAARTQVQLDADSLPSDDHHAR
jgi:plastocyanin